VPPLATLIETHRKTSGLFTSKPFFYGPRLRSLHLNHKSEHVLEHNLSNPKNFSAPPIYTAKGTFSKRWYVLFYLSKSRNRELERMKKCVREAKFGTKPRGRVLPCFVRFTEKIYYNFLKEGYIPLR